MDVLDLIGGVAIAVIFYFLPAFFPTMPKLVSRIGLAFGVLLLLVAIGLAFKTAPAPDLTLHFVNPKSPALVLVNKSSVIAREIKWQVALWDRDHPDRVDQLPIPVGGFDWLKPGEESIPRELFYLPSVTSLLKPGARLMGSALVSCSTCRKSRSYIVSVDLGNRAWFAEINVEGSGGLPVPEKHTREALIEYFNALESTPAQSRIPVSEKGGWVAIPGNAK
jgi:hypothetical protein